MRVFFDTSVFVAATLRAHVEHMAARTALEAIRRGDNAGHASTHTLAETFAVLTRMPTSPKLTPADVLAVLEQNILPWIGLVPLAVEDYVQAVRELAGRNQAGGKVFDALHLQAALRIAAERIYTFNVREWRQLAPDLATRITAPPAR